MSSPNPTPLRLATLEDVIGYCQNHEGTIQAYWAAQFLFNADIEGRVRAVEKRLVWAMAAVGTLAGFGGSVLGELAKAVAPTVAQAVGAFDVGAQAASFTF